MSSARVERPPRGDKLPYGLMSLWDMINSHIPAIIHVIEWLRHTENLAAKNPAEIIAGDKRDPVLRVVQNAESLCKKLKAQAALDRITALKSELAFSRDIANGHVATELRVLREILQSELSRSHFYHYPPAKAALLLDFATDWEGIIKAFPDVKEEALAAIDLYALGHDTASVFHSMRVAEHGLRSLAKERKIALPKKRPIEWGTWQDIIDRLDDEIKNIAKTKPAGSAKDRALSFYSGARADLNGFKDEYRNLVMHLRATYDEHQSLRAIRRVHDFMNRISEKIDHRHHRIRWGF
jgi:hypothetical protein